MTAVTPFTDWDTEQGKWEMKLSRGAALMALWELEDLLVDRPPQLGWSARVRRLFGL